MAQFNSASFGDLSTESIKKWIIEPSEVEIFKDKVLGQGAYGTVYKGRCRGKDVAVKRLQRQIRPQNLRALIEEVDTQSSLLHPNVLLFMGVCVELGNLMMITEYMPNETLLRKRKDFSIFRIMQFAKDAALGLCWLHGAKTIHSDLKLSNLLVDENLRVKVCDFGLSFRKTHKDELIKQSARGSPLYMSPECLTGKPFDEKSDVYAFGLILWEIYTRKELFPHIQTEEHLVEAVVNNNQRPPIPHDCPKSLAELMSRCWESDQTKRLSMPEALQALDRILIDCAIDDEIGRNFWKEYFIGKENVEWIDFSPALANVLKVSVESQLSNSNFACLRLLLNLPPFEHNGLVEIEKFGNVLKWFGPFILDPVENKGITFLDSISSMLLKKSFHPLASKRDSEVLLSSQSVGTYLLRFSSEPGNFGMSCVSTKGETKTVYHFRLRYIPGQGYEMDKQIFKTVDDFINEVRQSYGLKDALECDNNPLLPENYSPYEDKLSKKS